MGGAARGRVLRGEIATYCAAYKAEDLAEILRLSDHVIFNSPGQLERFAPEIALARAQGAAFDIGLRINPLHAEGEVPRYDPCAPHSRLGFPVDQLTDEHMEGVDGLHFHTLCEQDFEPLQRTWETLEAADRAILPAASSGSTSAAATTSPAPITSATNWSSSSAR